MTLALPREQAAPRWREHAAVRALVGVGVAVLVLRGLWWGFAGPVAGDTAWGLTIADQIAAGRVLYRDILEINPPLIFWLFGLARSLATLLTISGETAWRLLTLAVVSGVTWVSYRETGERRLLALIPLALIATVGRSFGQRDHLAVALLLPYLFRPSMPSGLAAGLAIAMKPHYALVWFGALLTRRKWERADKAIVATGLLYLLSVALFAPDYFSVVRTYGGLYGAFNDHSPLELLTPGILLASLAVAIGDRRLLLPAVGALLALLIQGKGWPYHAVPFYALAIVASGRAGIWLALLLALTPHWEALVKPWGHRIAPYEYAARLGLTSVQPGDSVLVLSTIVPDGSLRIRERGAVDVSSVPSLWWIRADPNHPAAHLARQKVAADLERRPDVVAVRRVGSLAAHLAAEPRIAAVLREYRVDTTDYFLVYHRD